MAVELKEDNKLSINREIIHRLLPYLSVIATLFLWELLAMSGRFGEMLPSPVKVLEQFLIMLREPVAGITLGGHIYISMRRVMIAFVIAVITGLPLGLLMGWSKTFEAITKPIFEIFRPIPPIAWIPLAILWFGIGETPKIFIVWVGVFVSAVINAYTGIKLIEPLLLNAAKTLGANRRQLFFEVAIPSSLPAIFAGLQNGLSHGWMCILAAEMVGAKEGIGYLILMGMEMNNPAMIITGMLIIGIVGALIALSLYYIERWVCPWQQEIITS